MFSNEKRTKLVGAITSLVKCEVYLNTNEKTGNYICPYCGNGIREDSESKFNLFPESKTFYCYECRRMGDVITLYQDRTGKKFEASLLDLSKEALKLSNDKELRSLIDEYELDYYNSQSALVNEETKTDDITKFLEDIQNKKYEPISSGLQWFDDLLGGGFMRDTVAFVMAAPATGKTTLCQQIAENMAAAGHKVVYMNFESNRNMMLAKAISSRLTQEHIFLTTTDILKGYAWNEAQREKITAAAKEYQEKILPNIKYNPDNVEHAKVEEIKRYLTSIGEASIERGTEAPIVFIDYLHLIRDSEKKGADIKEILKDASEAIRKYASDYHTFAVIISATNRDSNKDGVMSLTSGRDSSNIEYDADYAITMNYWAIDQKEVSAGDVEEVSKLELERMRQIILRNVKNRWGLTGLKERVYFNAANNTFYGENDFIPEELEEYKKDFTNAPRTSKDDKRAWRVSETVRDCKGRMLSEDEGVVSIDAVVKYFSSDRGYSRNNIKKWAESGKYNFILNGENLRYKVNNNDVRKR